MVTAPILDREEYIEQAYFFRVLRERLAANMPTQEILELISEEILSTTRLPLAIQFLATELKHSGLLSSGFARLSHYFTPFQTFVIRRTEDEGAKFNVDTALLALQREAEYRAGGRMKDEGRRMNKRTVSSSFILHPSSFQAALFVYQFEVMCRNRLGYDEGLDCMAADSLYSDDWRAYLQVVRHQVGLVDFADLIYLRSEFYVQEQKRQAPDYQPPVPPLFGEKEGKIARANRGRDPLYLFAALQRQLGYPEVPRPRPRNDPAAKLEALQARFRELEMRLRLLESEVRGQVDLSQFGKKDEG